MTRRQLEKMSNENIISPFIALQKNILLQQNHLLQQNKETSRHLLDQTTKLHRIRQKFYKKHSKKLIKNLLTLKGNNINLSNTQGENVQTFLTIPVALTTMIRKVLCCVSLMK